MSDTDVLVAEEFLISRHAPDMIDAVPVRKCGNSSTIARPPKKRHLKTATELTTAVVKEEVVIHYTEVAKSSHLSFEAVAAQYEALVQVSKRLCCIYTENSRNLREAHELHCKEDLGESVGLLLCNPPYNSAANKTFK